MSGPSFPFLAKLKRLPPGKDIEKYLSEEMSQNLKAIEAAILKLSQPFNYSITDNLGSFSTSGAGPDDVTGASVQITTDGRPVILQIVPRNDGGAMEIYSSNAALPSGLVVFRDSVSLGQASIPNAGSALHIWFDDPPAGPHTYKLCVYNGSTTYVNNIRFLARQL